RGADPAALAGRTAGRRGLITGPSPARRQRGSYRRPAHPRRATPWLGGGPSVEPSRRHREVTAREPRGPARATKATRWLGGGPRSGPSAEPSCRPSLARQPAARFAVIRPHFRVLPVDQAFLQVTAGYLSRYTRRRDMSAPVVAVIVIAAVVVIALALIVGSQQARRRRLREWFGPEYDRRVEDRGDRAQAERELAELSPRRDRLAIRPL